MFTKDLDDFIANSYRAKRVWFKKDLGIVFDIMFCDMIDITYLAFSASAGSEVVGA